MVFVNSPHTRMPKNTAQRGIATITDIRDGPHDPRHRHVQQHQHLRHQHQAGLEGLWDHLGSTRLPQFRQTHIVLRAHQNRHIGTQPADGTHDTHRH